jgi:predicted transglutaminase-like cysteine proteinase
MIPRAIPICLSAAISALYLSCTPITAAYAQASIDEPFGRPAVGAPEILMSATWGELLLEVNNDLSIIARCRVEPGSCSSPSASKFLAIVREGEEYEGLAQIGHINRAANYALRQEHGDQVDDEWTSPLVALAKGAGDCKQFALLKYAALREAGIPRDALRIVVVEVRSTHRQHAFVAVQNQDRWLLLDNRTSTLIESSKALDYYDPLYALDQNGVQQYLALGPIARSDTPIPGWAFTPIENY